MLREIQTSEDNYHGDLLGYETNMIADDGTMLALPTKFLTAAQHLQASYDRSRLKTLFDIQNEDEENHIMIQREARTHRKVGPILIKPDASYRELITISLF